MAFTVTRLHKWVTGNKYAEAYDVVADANSGVIQTGLGVVDFVVATVQSAATGSQKFKRNLSAASAAANGQIMVSSCTSGDQFTVIAYGR